MGRFGSFGSPSLIDKANPKQLTELINQADEAGKREDARKVMTIRYVFITALALIALIAVLCWMFLHYQKADALQQIVTLIVGLGGGGVGGFGVGRAVGPKSGD